MSAKLTAKPTAKTKPDEEQSERFIETALQLEADESGDNFERATAVITCEQPILPKSER